MLETIKLLLNRSDDDNIDELLNTLISICKQEAVAYCNLEEYIGDMDFIIIQMVIERYNRIGSESLKSQKASGITANYADYYGEKVVKLLNKFRKLKTV